MGQFRLHHFTSTCFPIHGSGALAAEVGGLAGSDLLRVGRRKAEFASEDVLTVLGHFLEISKTGKVLRARVSKESQLYDSRQLRPSYQRSANLLLY